MLALTYGLDNENSRPGHNRAAAGQVSGFKSAGHRPQAKRASAPTRAGHGYKSMLDLFIQYPAATWQVQVEAAPYVLGGFFAAGLVRALLPDELVARHLGGNGAGAVVKASLLGIPLPLCSCGVIPAAIGLRRQGAVTGGDAGLPAGRASHQCCHHHRGGAFLGTPGHLGLPGRHRRLRRGAGLVDRPTLPVERRRYRPLGAGGQRERLGLVETCGGGAAGCPDCMAAWAAAPAQRLWMR